jgi:hypothetical protein
VKTLDSLTSEEWEEIREHFGISKVLVWRAATAEESKRHQGRPVGIRLIDDGTYEVQINADAVRCRPRSVAKDQFALYCLYAALGHIALGHLNPQRQQEWAQTRLRGGRRLGLKTLRAELEAEASRWAVERLSRDDLIAVKTRSGLREAS